MDKKLPSRAEFIGLTAILISLTALSIDAMLPALPEIARDLHITAANQAQLIISVLFLGLAVGQGLFGPISDSTGRKPMIYVGLAIFIVGSAISMLASSFTMMLVGRFLQGLGASAPRVITMALVRDCYAGRAMAQIMSFTMMVFILVPALAPALGQLVIHFAGWHAIFATFIVLAMLVWVWLGLRLPETLPAEKRSTFSLQTIATAAKVVVTNRRSMGYTVVSGVIFGAFMGYLNSVQQIFQVQYGLGDRFPAYFALTALAVGAASFVNARLVMQLGMRVLSRTALMIMTSLATLFLGVVWFTQGHPPLWMLMVFLLTLFFCVGLLFGNLNALAMEPLNRYAGMGASIIGSLSTFTSIPLGTWIGQSYDGTIMPLIMGFAGSGAVALLLMQLIEHYAPMPPAERHEAKSH